MKVMSNLYPETNKPNTDNKATTSSMLLGCENEILTKYGVIPKQITENDVIDLAKKSGSYEANVIKMKLWSEQSLNAQNTALNALDVRINHASQSMKNQEQFKKKMSKHGRDIASHNLVNQVTQSSYDGFQMALNSASETIAI